MLARSAFATRFSFDDFRVRRLSPAHRFFRVATDWLALRAATTASAPLKTSHLALSRVSSVFSRLAARVALFW